MTIVRAKPIGLGQSNADAGYDRGGNARGSIADDGGRESVPADRRGIASNLAGRSKVNMVWKGHRSRLHKYKYFNAYGLFSMDTATAASKFFHGPQCDLARLWRRV